jgi:hypothetical protein
MSCDCRENIEKKLLTRFKEQEPDAKDHHVRLDGYCFVIINNNDFDSNGRMVIESEAIFKLKNGKTKLKKSKQNMLFTYCPFCAKPYEDKEEDMPDLEDSILK